MRFIETKKGRVTLWAVQGLLALLYLFAGGSKLVMSPDVLAEQAHLPGLFMKFIGLCEVAGAFGLILPGLLRVARVLTPLAAAGLVILMVGATTLTAARMGFAPAAFPLVAGLLAAFVAYGRWPHGALRVHEPRPAG